MKNHAIMNPNMIAPPPYSEALVNEACEAPLEPNFCSSCGNKLENLQIACPACHVLVNQPMQMGAGKGNSIAPAPVIMQQPYSQPPPNNDAVVIQESVSLSNIEFYKVYDGRLIIDFEKVSCLPFETVGIKQQNMDCCPDPLKKKGITDSDWQKWMQDLMVVQKKAPSVIGCLTIFCCPGLLIQSMLCAMFCPTSKSHFLDCLPCFYGDWYRGLTEWTTKVNAVLNDKDMHAKLLTYKPYSRAPKSMFFSDRVTGKDHNYEMSFLAIGLNKSASEKLIGESWDHGVNDGCFSGNGRIL